MYKVRSLFIVLLFLLIIASPANALPLFWNNTFKDIDDNDIPDDAWVFTSQGTLQNKEGLTISLDTILAKKKLDVAEEFRRKGVDKFPNAEIDGSLDGQDYLWGKAITVDYFSKKSKGTLINMKAGGTTYPVYIPRGVKNSGDGSASVNRNYISYAVSAINAYKEAVKHGVLIGSVGASYQVLTAYSDTKQLLVGSGRETDGSSGLMVPAGNGYYIFGGTGISNVKYSLEYLYSPLFGKIEAKDVPRSNEAWDKLLGKVVLVPDTAGRRLSVELDKGYLSFMNETSVERKSIQRVEDDIPSSRSNGVPGYRLSSNTFKPIDLVDYKMRVIVPARFQLSDNKRYKIAEDGFQLIDNIRISLYDNKVYEVSGDGSASELGSLRDFGGLTGEYLTLYYYKVDGKKVGAVVPLKYREAVYNTSASGDGLEVYLTGRDIVFNNDYSGNLKFDAPNLDMMDIVVTRGGKEGAVVKDFAFAVGVDPKKKESHKSIGESLVAEFEFKYDIVADNNAKGFVIYRNNAYIQDSSLIRWLNTAEAQSLTGIRSDELLAKITGRFEVESNELSYDEWIRMVEIKQELEMEKRNKLPAFTRALAIFFGAVIILYFIFLMIAYVLDLFNFGLGVSLVRIMTFGRLQPVSSRDVIRVLGDNTNVRYVLPLEMVVIFCIGVIVGSLFMFNSAILKFIVKLYLYFVNLFGGVV